MRFFFFISIVLLLLETPAKSFLENTDLSKGDSTSGETISSIHDLSTTTSDVQDSQGLTMIVDDEQRMEFPVDPEDRYGLNTAILDADAISLGNSDIFVAAQIIGANDCSFSMTEAGLKTRRGIIPEWLPVPDWSPWPPKDTGPDICIPQKLEEPECKPGEETLCCNGKSNWMDDSLVFVVTGCIRCTFSIVLSYYRRDIKSCQCS